MKLALAIATIVCGVSIFGCSGGAADADASLKPSKPTTDVPKNPNKPSFAAAGGNAPGAAPGAGMSATPPPK